MLYWLSDYSDKLQFFNLFRYITYAGISRLSVNTQSDNQASLSLYQRMGFRATRRFAAYVWEGF